MTRPALEILRPPREDDLHFLTLLNRLAPAGWDGLRPADYLAEIRAANVWAFIVGEPGAGLALLRITTNPVMKCLHLDGLVGQNVVTKCQAIGRDLRTIAREYGCAEIEAASAIMKFGSVAKRLGFAPVATIYRQKVN